MAKKTGRNPGSRQGPGLRGPASSLPWDGGGEGSIPPGLLGAGKGPGASGRGKGGALRLATRILTAIALGLVLVILAGTLYALFKAREDSGAAPAIRNSGEAGIAMFTGIGRLRIAAGSGSRAAVIVSIVFPYSPEDRPFTEELAGKIPLFRRIAREYFGALSAYDLNPLDEQKAKAELLRRFNNELRLGTIESLLFNDLMILE